MNQPDPLSGILNDLRRQLGDRLNPTEEAEADAARRPPPDRPGVLAIRPACATTEEWVARYRNLGTPGGTPRITEAEARPVPRADRSLSDEF